MPALVPALGIAGDWRDRISFYYNKLLTLLELLGVRVLITYPGGVVPMLAASCLILRSRRSKSFLARSLENAEMLMAATA